MNQTFGPGFSLKLVDQPPEGVVSVQAICERVPPPQPWLVGYMLGYRRWKDGVVSQVDGVTHVPFSERIIFDIGAHNGDDLEYYLLCAYRVIAVEANPVLAAGIRQRYERALNSGRLVVVNCAVTPKQEDGQSMTFFVHDSNDLLSTAELPSASFRHLFREITVPSATLSQLLEEYGEPWFLKLDLEGLDAAVLDALFETKSRPRYLSVEAHTPQILDQLINQGGYNAFKLVDGASMSAMYKLRRLRMGEKGTRHSFPYNAAGPFADDVRGRWASAARFQQRMQLEGFGWKDIHASRSELDVNQSRYGKFEYLLGLAQRRSLVFADRILTNIDAVTRQRIL